MYYTRDEALITENDQGLTLDLKMAGLERDNISLNIESSVLKAEGSNDTYSYSYSYVIPKKFNVSNIDASYKNGILSIKIPLDKSYKTSIKIT